MRNIYRYNTNILYAYLENCTNCYKINMQIYEFIFYVAMKIIEYFTKCTQSPNYIEPCINKVVAKHLCRSR